MFLGKVICISGPSGPLDVDVLPLTSQGIPVVVSGPGRRLLSLHWLMYPAVT